MNNIYNFQDTIIVCERKGKRNDEKNFDIIKNLAQWLHSPFLSKTIILLPTKAKIVDLFQQTLISGFICINMQLISIRFENFKQELKENL